MCLCHRRLIFMLATFAIVPGLTLLSPYEVTAQEPPAAVEEVKEEVKEEVAELEAELEAAKKEAEEDAKAAASVAKESEPRKSADGAYEFKRYFGGGVEFGLFFTPFERWNTQLLEPNNATPFDTDVALNLDLALEVAPIEGTRLTLFGGWQTSATSDPSISALYLGIEPAFAYRNTRFELAVGSGFGLGRLDFALEDGRSAQAGLFMLRPFVEARTYANEFAAFYARFGFNYWHVYDEELNGLNPTNRRPAAASDASSNLNEGGVYLAIGTRFGHYPDPVKRVPDSDGDGLRDDVDACPDEPEDFDGFQDEDGCPDLDNDEDGIPDADDECPNEPGIPELKGCAPKDTDGDGIFDHLDTCPNEPEDFDGFEDEDGCPDPDNDQDGILDGDDECPNEPGVPELKGCPIRDRDGDGIPDHLDKCPDEPETYNGFEDEDGCPDGAQTVVITKTEIKILEQVFFDTGKATIKPASFPLLNTVATALRQNPQITGLLVEGHTDDVGNDARNLELSKARAASVKDYLINEGKIDVSRLSSEGFGESAPLCADIPELLKARKPKAEVEACRSQNRRVQFKIISVNGEPVSASESVTIEEEKIINIETPTTP